MQRNSRNERDIITYRQLLHMAHQRGLKSIRTSLLQTPCADNAWVAIARAEAVLVGEDGIERVFEEIGDAGPTNLAPMVAACAIRMAATRAKARALRDAVDVGAVAAEELSDYDGGTGEQGLGTRERRSPVPQSLVPSPSKERTANTIAPDSLCTADQKRAVLNVVTRLGIEKPENLETMTQGTAAELLRSLQAGRSRAA